MQPCLRAGLPFAVAAVLLACKSETPGTSAATAKVQAPLAHSESAEEHKQASSWQRMKECAEQADRMLKDWERVPKGWEKLAESVQLVGWENHYSPKYGRCYVQIALEDKMSNGELDDRSFRYELYDAFERRQLASCSAWSEPSAVTALRGVAGMVCTFQGMIDEHYDPKNVKLNCSLCTGYMLDRMNN